MVFKPFTHLARQKFVKSFTHGYAQTVVAASQSSYAASTASFPPFAHPAVGRVGKSGSLQVHNAFQSSSGSSGAGTYAGSSTTNHSTDGGLAAYYAAWQQQQLYPDGDEDHKWKQFQFSKRIEWTAPAPSQDVVEDGKQHATNAADTAGPFPVPGLARRKLGRANSVSAIDVLRNIEGTSERPIESIKLGDSVDSPAEAALAIVNESQEAHEAVSREAGQDAAGNVILADETSKLASISTTTITNSDFPITDVDRAETFATASESRAFLDQIDKLHLAGRHEEVPGVFEAMLVAKVRPTPDAYNALLAAAVRLPAPTHHTVHKALTVYTDMLQRRVMPNTSTYSTLIELLAARALEVSEASRSLRERRTRYPSGLGSGRSMFASLDAEHDFLADDESCGIALRLFNASKRDPELRAFPLVTYEHLASLCAEYGKTAEMIDMYAHMETQRVTPSTRIFTSMITGFARSWDLVSAVECYNEYKILAMAADDGQLSIIDRQDDLVYVALVKAYVTCYKIEGAQRFLNKVRDLHSSGPVEQTPARLQALEDLVVPSAFVDQLLDLGRFHEALDWTESANLSVPVRTRALARVCTKAADHNEAKTAAQAFASLGPLASERSDAAMALLALHVRLGDLPSATAYWELLTAEGMQWSSTFVEPSTMFAAALLDQGKDEVALQLARQSFARIRSSLAPGKGRSTAVEAVDEAIQYLGRFMKEKGIVPSARASMELMWTMIENGGLITPVAIQLLSGLGPQSLDHVAFNDLILLAQVQGGMLLKDAAMTDIAGRERFAQVVEIILARRLPLDQRTKDLVEQCLRAVSSPDMPIGWTGLLRRWHEYIQPPTLQSPAQLYSPQTISSASPITDYDAAFDPYASSTDHRGSSIIFDELERKAGPSGGVRLKEALSTLRNIRRAGRHPRYLTYAKLISAAAKENRIDLAREVLAMAKTDIPYVPHSQAVHQGWTAILDAMVATCLGTADRASAAQYHQDLLNMGSAPSANTFGLYITTLKESTKTFDEATEAVKIFHRAKSEGVEPSSFLYNALIGKLGKARRIDDCLFYFAEMRNLGIRPTSVTYGTVVNALCRVSDERFAEELFEEMESMPNYKPRPAPYNTLMQFFLTTKRDRTKVLAYYDRMMSKGIAPASHTFKLLIDTYATLEPVDMASAEGVLDKIRQAGLKPEAVHYASLIHAKGCTLHDQEGARQSFNEVLADRSIRPQACIYQAFLETMVANHEVAETQPVLDDMRRRGVAMTPYIANTLIHGWAHEGNVEKAKAIFEGIGVAKREPSTYEAMTRAFLATEDQESALRVVRELSTRGYPSAVVDKVYDLVGLRNKQARSFTSSSDSN